MKKLTSVVLITILSYLNITFSQTLSIAAFNVNSAVTKPTKIARQMKKIQDIDIWALEESTENWIDPVGEVLGQQYNSIHGTTGFKNSKLQIYYNESKLVLLEHIELDYINSFHRVRAPLVAKFKIKDSEQIFLVMVNHLYRGKATARHQQAQQINDWVKEQQYPVIAVGDYNFDLSPYNISEHDLGFDLITQNNLMSWIMPKHLLPSQCDERYNSILDFIFVGNAAKEWHGESEILFTEDEQYCKMLGENSDHRPIVGRFSY